MGTDVREVTADIVGGGCSTSRGHYSRHKYRTSSSCTSTTEDLRGLETEQHHRVRSCPDLCFPITADAVVCRVDYPTRVRLPRQDRSSWVEVIRALGLPHVWVDGEPTARRSREQRSRVQPTRVQRTPRTSDVQTSGRVEHHHVRCYDALFYAAALSSCAIWFRCGSASTRSDRTCDLRQ